MAGMKHWLAATRPKTLAAGIIPVGIGSSLAAADGAFAAGPAAAALGGSILIQIATNFINEVYDFRRGADTAERLGPQRQVAEGTISERAMVRASILVAAAAFALGLYLATVAGIGIFVVGLISLFCAWAYTGGPFPIAYKGLGEIFVFIFFGVVALAGTYYVQALHLSWTSLALGLGPGALSSNILGVNNLRDIHTDPRAGKITLAVRMGAPAARRMYLSFVILAYAVPPLLLPAGYSVWCLLPLLTLPLAVILIRQVYSREGAALNATLAGSARLLVLYGALLAIGLLL